MTTQSQYFKEKPPIFCKLCQKHIKTKFLRYFCDDCLSRENHNKTFDARIQVMIRMDKEKSIKLQHKNKGYKH